MIESTTEPYQAESARQDNGQKTEPLNFYRIRFREKGQEFTASSCIDDLARGETVMVRTEHNPEPAVIVSRAAEGDGAGVERKASYEILRRTTSEEAAKYVHLPFLEQEAFAICQDRIEFLRLPMNLVRVERFFNGSKIIFYFTAESRVDFRELVKKLVQEFRTRVEMRQIGVRHETQMIGGLGSCGRELCCTSFLRKFESVSIKMAKTQDLPLNPSKISGVCNRLLCCLTYEYDAYKSIKQEMPRMGHLLKHEGDVYRVTRIHPLQGTVRAFSREQGEVVLTEEQWKAAEPVKKKQSRRKKQTEKQKNRKSGTRKKKQYKG